LLLWHVYIEITKMFEFSFQELDASNVEYFSFQQTLQLPSSGRISVEGVRSSYIDLAV
jgi:hypothetical protein